MLLRLLRHCGLLMLALLGMAVASQPLAEAELKAQILWRALQFVEWPGEVSPSQPLHLCLMSQGPLSEALREWEQRPLNGRRLELRRVGSVGAAAGCHIIYVSAEVSVPAQPPRGVMINLQPQQGRIVFDVDLHSARRAGLDINARLLRLARYVRTEGTP